MSGEIRVGYAAERALYMQDTGANDVHILE